MTARIDIKNAVFKIQDGSDPANTITARVGEGNLTYDETQEREYLLERGKLDAVRDGDDTPMSVSFDFVWDQLIGPEVLAATAIDDAGTPAGPFAIGATQISVDSMASIPVQGRFFTIAGDSTQYKVVSATATTITLTPALVASPADNAAVTFVNTITIEDALRKRNGAASWVSASDDQCEPFAVDIVVEHTPICGDDQVETITLPEFRFESLSHDLRAGTVSCSGRCNATQAIVVKS